MLPGIARDAALPYSSNRAGNAHMPWYAPVGLNEGHWAARNCVFLACFNQYSIEPWALRNLAAKNGQVSSSPTVVGSSITPVIRAGNMGLNFSGDGNADRITYGTLVSSDRASLSHTNEATFMWCGTNLTTGTSPSSQPAVICSGFGTGGNSDQDWAIQHDRSFNHLIFNIGNEIHGTGTNDFPEGTSQFRPYTAAEVWNADVLTIYSDLDEEGNDLVNPYLYRVGQNGSFGFGTGNFPFNAGAEISVGNHGGGSTDRNWEGDLYWVAVFDRALAEWELSDLMIGGGMARLATSYQMAPRARLEGAPALVAGPSSQPSGAVSVIIT